MLSIAVVASATFILISVDAFRRDRTRTPPIRGPAPAATPARRHGAADRARSGQRRRPRALGLGDAGRRPRRRRFACCAGRRCELPEPVRAARSRGSSARRARSSPRAASVSEASLDRSDDERANPWLLLERAAAPTGAIPVDRRRQLDDLRPAQAVGDDIVITRNGRRIRLRLVAALADSVLQGELIMSEANFLRAVSRARRAIGSCWSTCRRHGRPRCRRHVEDRLSDFGADATPAAQRLAEFHRVENTYLSTFQTLGGPGPAARHDRARRRAPAQRARAAARAGAARRGRLRPGPHAHHRDGRKRAAARMRTGDRGDLGADRHGAGRGRARGTGAGRGTAWLLVFAVLATGLVSSIVATRAAMHSRLLDALRAE